MPLPRSLYTIPLSVRNYPRLIRREHLHSKRDTISVSLLLFYGLRARSFWRTTNSTTHLNYNDDS